MEGLRLDLVHLNLDHPPIPFLELQGLLSSEERERASRFRTDQLRRRWTASRGLVRTLLGQAIGRRPHEIQIRTGAHGKPFIPGGPEFNLSHSGKHLLVGLAEAVEMGVDVEEVRPLSDLWSLARRYFSPSEMGELEALPAQEADRAFFQVWARKEAYMKATGLGMDLPLSSFTVEVARSKGNLLRNSSYGEGEGMDWSIRCLGNLGNAVAAVAYNASDVDVVWLRPSEIFGNP